MGGVYSNSLCNFTATVSSDGRGGLFLDRDSNATLPSLVHATWDGLQKGYFLCFARFEWNYEVVQASLNRRA
jgi:hypothetical protein